MNQPESIEELFENDPVAIKLHEAAYEMGKGDVFLQQAIKQGKCAFGYGAETKEGRWVYLISRVQFEEYLGTGDRKYKNLTLTEAAKIAGKHYIGIKNAIIQGRSPYGMCVETSPGKYDCHISRKQFNKWWRIEQGMEKVYVVKTETAEIPLNDEADAWRVYDELRKYCLVSEPEERRL